MLKKIVLSTSNRISVLTKFSFFCYREKVTKVNLNKKVSSDKVYKWLMLVIPATSFGIGCWQTYRLRWKLDLIDKIQENLNSPIAIDLPHDIVQIENMEYKPVQVRGEFVYEREFLMGPRSLNNSKQKMSDTKNKSGWLVITPFKLSHSSEIILVNRGWIPKNMKYKLQELRPKSKQVEITGILRLSEEVFSYLPQNQPDKKIWLYRNLKEMSAYFGCLPVWLDIKEESSSAEWPIPNQTKLNIRNEHFSYMVTWYSLAIFTTFMWYRKFVKII